MSLDKRIKAFSYKITSDPEEADHKQYYNEEIEDKLHDTYLKIQKGKIRSAQDILKLIKRYPNVPAFKNYLSVFYAQKGKFDKAMNVNLALIEEHPDYLYGKLNLCAKYFESEELEKIPEILGEALDLKDLYPDRNVFHQQEFSSFLNTSCRYLIATQNFAAVETRLEPATQFLGKDHPSIVSLNELMEEAKFEQAHAKYEKKAELRDIARAEFSKKDISEIQTTEPPTFHHDEILELYKNGVNIDKYILEKILNLPRKTLLEDFEKVLLDSICRLDFISEKITEEEKWDESSSFPLHALSLITALNAKEKLPVILRHLSEDEGVLDYWYNDHMYETMWKYVYHLAQDDLEMLKAFQKDKTYTKFPKIIILQAVTQIAHHQPERKAEVIQWYHDVFNFFLENVDDLLLCDVDVVSLAICETCDLLDESFLPIAKKFYDLDMVDLIMCGDYEEYKSLVSEKEHSVIKNNLFGNIYDHYQLVMAEWYGYETDEQREKRIAEMEQRIAALDKEKAAEKEKLRGIQQQLAEKNSSVKSKSVAKVGRNEPCPCGSGKKYKKCCIEL